MQLHSRHRRLFGVLLFNFLVFGITVTIYGAIVPTAIREFHWSYLATGVVLAASSVGYFASSFASGFLVERLGAKRVVCLGLVLQAGGLALFGSVPGILFNLFSTFLVGLGQGGTEVVTNFCVVRIEKAGQSRLMNLMHASFPVGAISGPILVGWFLSAGIPWQFVFRGLSVLSVAIAIVMALTSFVSIGEAAEEDTRERDLGRLLGNPLLILLFLTIFLYVGSEIGVSSWISEYYVKVFDVSASAAAFMVSVFWAGVLVGRFGVFLLYQGYRQAEILFSISCLALASLLVSLLVPLRPAATAGFLVCGLGYSAVYPVVMAIVGNQFKRGQSVALGFVSTGGGVGSFLFPFIMAAIADAYGIRNGFWFYTVTTLAMALAAGGVLYLVRRAKAIGT